MKIKISQIKGNPYQVRTIVNDLELNELADSIREHGLLQPIKVRPLGNDFELVYGHRRLEAMKLLGWTECEVTIEGISDDDSLVQSITENLQRQDLDILDEAKSYEVLRQRGYTIKEIAEIVKKPHGRISNRLSILNLPVDVQQLVQTTKSQHASTTELGGLSADSASRIASVINSPSEAMSLAAKAIEEELNSREIRELTSLLKEIPYPSERELLIRKPWRSNSDDHTRLPTIEKSDDPKPNHQLSISGQFHNKVVWNLQRIDVDKFDHFTIGYSERSIDQFIELLKIAKIDLLADVRKMPVSRFKPEFSKTNLEKSVTSVGIDYIHWPNLGIPSSLRQEINYDTIFVWYMENVRPQQLLIDRRELLNTKRIAFMCVELDPESCHRHCISLSLEEIGYKMFDL